MPALELLPKLLKQTVPLALCLAVRFTPVSRFLSSIVAKYESRVFFWELAQFFIELREQQCILYAANARLQGGIVKLALEVLPTTCHVARTPFYASDSG
ncbi:MAG TPA: hypothetical protein PKE00_12960 [Planctomycetota bacterium]|nr:hypothetical protein [Planctomycetota bacterium]